MWWNPECLNRIKNVDQLGPSNECCSREGGVRSAVSKAGNEGACLPIVDSPPPAVFPGNTTTCINACTIV